DNNIFLAVGEFPDGNNNNNNNDVQISPKLTISPHHHIAAAAIHEGLSPVAAVVCAIVYESRLPNSVHRPLWKVIGVGDLPDNTWIEQRGLFSSSSSPHQFIAVTNGTSMEGWLQEGDTICNEALRWLLYTYNEDVREVLPTASSSSSSTADDGISAAEKSGDESTVTSSSNNDKSVDGILSLTDVRWAYILLKGYGVWGEDVYYYHPNNEDTTTSPTPMLISPLVFARPHYRKGSRIINYNVVYPDPSHGRASDEVIINSDEEPSYSDDNDNDEDRDNREDDGEYDDIHHNTVLYTLLHHGYYDNNTHDSNELNNNTNATNKKGVDMAVVINGRLSYKLELYAAKALLRSIQDYNAKNMIESSRRLQEGGDVSLLKDKSLLQIPVMEVREIEAGLLVQLIHTIQDYIAIIDHDVYDCNIGDDVNADSGHVLGGPSYQDNGDDKTVDDNNRRTKKGSNDSNKNNKKPTK
ncbi:hypothetical protein FOZ63_006970, partial [Perkinsus olseni]